MEALILSRRDFREFDQIVSLYSKEKGKIELLARGVKKQLSKNSAHLEPFANVFVEMAVGREIDHLIKVVPIYFFPNIRKNLHKSLAAGYAAYFLDKITEPESPEKTTYAIFLSWLKFLENHESFKFVLLDALVMAFLVETGLHPVLEYCVVCEKDKSAMGLDNGMGFYLRGGGMICAACRQDKEKIGERICDFNLALTSLFGLLLQENWQLINNFEFSKEEMRSLHNLVYEFALFHIEKNIKNWGEFENL